MRGAVEIALEIDSYVRRKNAKRKPVTYAVRAVVRKTVPKTRELLNAWGIPILEWNGSLCYLMVGKNPRHIWFPSRLIPARLFPPTRRHREKSAARQTPRNL
jgi:hypothetical protein